MSCPVCYPGTYGDLCEKHAAELRGWIDKSTRHGAVSRTYALYKALEAFQGEGVTA